MKGRKPKPVELRVIQGNPGKRALPMPIEVGAGLPEPPDHLDAIAKAEWDRILPELDIMGLVTKPDRSALAAYCVNYSRWVKAEVRMNDTGMLFRNASGRLVKSPFVEISNRAMELMHKFLTEFGMTPVSRTRLSATPGESQKNPFANIG